MIIAIDHLDADELWGLKHRIIERLKMPESLRAHQSIMQFRLGTWVGFYSSQAGRLIGILVKFNR